MLRSRRVALLVALSAAAAAPAAARADTFCVAPAGPPGCTGTAEPTLSSAIGATVGTAGRDRIVLGAATYTGGGSGYYVPSGVDLIGAGQGASIITAATAGSLMALTDDDTISDLTLREQGNTNEGLILSGTSVAERVAIDGLPRTVGGYGVRLDGPNTAFRHGAVRMSRAGAQPGAAVVFTSTGGEVSDSVLEAQTGISAIASGHGQVHRSRIDGEFGIVPGSGQVEIDSSLVRVSAAAGDTAGVHWAIAADPAASSDTSATGTVLGAGLTLVAPAGLADTSAFACSAGGSHTGAVNVYGSAITGFAHRSSGGASPGCSIDYAYANFDAGSTEDGGGTPGSGVTTLAPRFADPAHGDFRPRWDSPLVGTGRPGPIDAGDSTTDLLLQPRFVGSAVDRGASEYQRRPPAVTARAGGSVTTGAPARFTATGSDPDPAETAALVYAWRFDDGATAAGPSVSHAFAGAGRHTGTVTVRDPTAQTATATAAVTVTPPPPPPGVAPVLTHVALHPALFRARRSGTTRLTGRAARRPPRGTSIRFTLSKAAAMKFVIVRKAAGRRSRGRCVRPRASLVRAHARRCVRIVAAGSFRRSASAGARRVAFSGRLHGRALVPGSYRITLSPTDSGHRRGRAVARKFRIAR